MAEFCLKCFNELEGTDFFEDEVWVDYSELCICEGCGELRPCVVDLHPKPLGERFLDLVSKRRRKIISIAHPQKKHHAKPVKK